MIHLLSDRLETLLSACSSSKIMVIGDLMIDRYLWGKVTRISPEAPVPIINIEEDEIRFGGAANVANNILGLKAEPILVGAIGKDSGGILFRELLEKQHLRSAGLIEDPSRPTTFKTRIIGNNQHIARVDREHTHPITGETVNRIVALVEEMIGDVDAIILQDYNKGVMVPDLIRRVIALARKHHKIITVDPKFEHFLEYRGVTLFKPNRKEAEEALATRLGSEEEVVAAGELLLQKLQAQAVLITLSERGVALFQRDAAPMFSHTRARKVADVSGAGDTVIATVTTALAAGATLPEAVTLANFAAGVVCGEVGAVPISAVALRERVGQAIMEG